MADNHYSILFLMSYSQVCNDEVLNLDYNYVIRITTVFSVQLVVLIKFITRRVD